MPCGTPPCSCTLLRYLVLPPVFSSSPEGDAVLQRITATRCEEMCRSHISWRPWHAGCFACDLCRAPHPPGASFIPRGEPPGSVCARCHVDHVAPKCARCGDGVADAASNGTTDECADEPNECADEPDERSDKQPDESADTPSRIDPCSRWTDNKDRL